MRRIPRLRPELCIRIVAPAVAAVLIVSNTPDESSALAGDVRRARRLHSKQSPEKSGFASKSTRTRRTPAGPFAHSSTPPEERARPREIGDALSPTRPLVAQKKHNTPPYDPRVAGREFGALPPPSLSFCASSFRMIFWRAASSDALRLTVRLLSSNSSKSDLTAFDKGFSATHSSWGRAASLTPRAAAPSRFVVATAVAWAGVIFDFATKFSNLMRRRVWRASMAASVKGSK